MTDNKKHSHIYGRLGGLVCLLAAILLFTCEKIPDHCGKYEKYDPKFQFCFGGYAHKLCSDGEYNPLTQGCDKSNLVGTRCLDSSVVKPGTPCGGYNLTAAAAPAVGGEVEIFRSSSSLHYEAGEEVVLVATPKADYTFAGWTGASASKDSRVTIEMNGNKPMVAMFNPKSESGASEYTLFTTAFPANGGTVKRNQDGPDYAAGTSVTVTAEAAEGYAFTGWSGVDESSSVTATVTMNSGKTVVAMFTPKEYTLTVNAVPETGGSVFVNGTALAGAARQDAGKIEALAQPAEGYVFTGWSGSGQATGTTNPVTIEITGGNPTLTANFQKINTPPTTHTLFISIRQPGNGTVSLDPPGGNYRAGTPVTATANPTAGYTFTGWSGAAAGMDNSVVITMPDGNMTLIASFMQDAVTQPTTFTLTVERIPADGGTTVPASSQANIAAGTAVNISATAASGYTFDKWMLVSVSGTATFANANSASTTVTLNSDATIRANFTGGTISSTDSSFTYDGQTYRTVSIGGKRWMAENLNYAGSGGDIGVCYSGFNYFTNAQETDGCGKYGRLYTWAEVMGLPDSCNTKSCASQVQNLHRGICPAGWHVPSDAEWTALTEAVGGASTAGTKLKSKTGWNYIPGTDDYGFSALPGGSGYGGDLINAGIRGHWWSATEYGADGAWDRYMNGNDENVSRLNYNKASGYSARCAKDMVR